MKNTILRLLPVFGLALFSATADAQTINVSYPAIYPFVAMDTQEIYDTVSTVTEDQLFLRNIRDMISPELSEASSESKPWTSSYWPLAKGSIADPYENSSLGYNLDIGWVDWKDNYKSLVKRRAKVHSRIDELSQKELDKLAPSEKYDVLMGDESFDLTNRIVNYMNNWGSKKENAFITNISLVGEDSLELAKEYLVTFSEQYADIEAAFRNSYVIKDTLSVRYSLDLLEAGKYKSVEDAFPEALELAKAEGSNFVLAKKNKRMASWEGICNGWSTAAGLVPRPRKTATFNLPSGKKLNFYPDDIKGLVSQFWVNSSIQDEVGANYIDKITKQPTIQGTLIAGSRCNSSKIKKDIWGRVYDNVVNSFTGKREAPCAGVHPAIWHLGVVNLIGVQKRSFVVERKVGTAVDNHPMYKYELKYFNPNRVSRYFKPASKKNKRNLEDVLVEIDEKDQFRQLRNPRAKFIVGVEMEMTYLNYARPKRVEFNSEEDDKEVDKKMYYDLELDQDLNIVGGQWRAVKTGQVGDDDRLNHKQPDFFWVISKNYKKPGWFDDEQDLEAWTDTNSTPPKSWLEMAHRYHSYEIEKTYEWNSNDNCKMKDKRTGEYIDVLCESKTNRPQPLINVLNKLVELTK